MQTAPAVRPQRCFALLLSKMLAMDAIVTAQQHAQYSFFFYGPLQLKKPLGCKERDDIATFIEDCSTMAQDCVALQYDVDPVTLVECLIGRVVWRSNGQHLWVPTFCHFVGHNCDSNVLSTKNPERSLRFKTARNIKAGETLCWSLNQFLHLPKSMRNRVLERAVPFKCECDACKRDETPNCETCSEADPAKLRNCSDCGKATYCSKACQQADWNYHKLYCQRYKQKDVDRGCKVSGEEE